MDKTVNIIRQRMSLREPLADALEVMAKLTDNMSLTKPSSQGTDTDDNAYKLYLKTNYAEYRKYAHHVKILNEIFHHLRSQSQPASARQD